jgi:PhoD-like phosphatase/Secretion system C-terminal sorting domain
VPHYPLVAGTGDVPIYQAFSVGRTRFILTDNRSLKTPFEETDSPGKSILGQQQKEWFKKELLNSSGKYPLIFWVNSLPWIGTEGSDGWFGYTYERRELANFIKDNQIKGLIMLSGDAHMVAIDDGTNSDYADGGGAAFPVFHAAPLDRSPSIKGGPYSHGTFTEDSQFGYVTIIDSGSSKIEVILSGRDSLNNELVNYTFNVDANATALKSLKPQIPSVINLFQNYPNPFNPVTTIKYDLKQAGFVKLKVYENNGKLVQTLVSSNQKKGVYRVPFNASDLASGIYYYKLFVTFSDGKLQPGFEAFNKMVLIR